MRKPFFFFLILLILIVPNVLAVKPVAQVGVFDEGLEIKFPAITAIKQGSGVIANFHVYNISNGLPVVEGISCYLHLFNGSGSHILKEETSTPSFDFDFDFEIDKGNFSKLGVGSYLIACNNSEVGGFASNSYVINQSGSDEENSYFLLLLCFIPLIFGLFALFGSYFLESNHHKVLKIGLFLFSFVTFFVSTWWAYIVVAMQFPNLENLQNAIGDVTFIFGIIITVIIVYYMIYIFKQTIGQASDAPPEEKDLEY